MNVWRATFWILSSYGRKVLKSNDIFPRTDRLEICHFWLHASVFFDPSKTEIKGTFLAVSHVKLRAAMWNRSVSSFSQFSNRFLTSSSWRLSFGIFFRWLLLSEILAHLMKLQIKPSEFSPSFKFPWHSHSCSWPSYQFPCSAVPADKAHGEFNLHSLGTGIYRPQQWILRSTVRSKKGIIRNFFRNSEFSIFLLSSI